MKPGGLRLFWEDFIIQTLKSKAHISKRTHLAYTPLNVTIPYPIFSSGMGVGWEDLNYHETKKVARLKGWYLPEDLPQKISGSINRDSHKYSSISTSMINREKNVRGTQGHCIQTITATRHFRQVYFSFFYRSVDLCLAWAADLKFMSEHVIPPILEEIDPRYRNIVQVSYHFSNANIEAITMVFFVVLSERYHEFLELMLATDPTVHLNFHRFISPLFQEEVIHCKLKRARRQQLYFQRKIESKPELEEYLYNSLIKLKLLRRKIR